MQISENLSINNFHSFTFTLIRNCVLKLYMQQKIDCFSICSFDTRIQHFACVRLTPTRSYTNNFFLYLSSQMIRYYHSWRQKQILFANQTKLHSLEVRNRCAINLSLLITLCLFLAPTTIMWCKGNTFNFVVKKRSKS
jgi:hypothetical protein